MGSPSAKKLYAFLRPDADSRPAERDRAAARIREMADKAGVPTDAFLADFGLNPAWLHAWEAKRRANAETDGERPPVDVASAMDRIAALEAIVHLADRESPEADAALRRAAHAVARMSGGEREALASPVLAAGKTRPTA